VTPQARLVCTLPRPRRLDNQPGTADNNAETLVDRYQGLWYSCVFFIQGTAAGVNIERRVCQETSSLTPGTNIPDQLVGIQVLSVIGVSIRLAGPAALAARASACR